MVVRLEPFVPLAQLGLKHGGAGCIGFALSVVAEPLPGEWPGNLDPPLFLDLFPHKMPAVKTSTTGET